MINFTKLMIFFTKLMVFLEENTLVWPVTKHAFLRETTSFKCISDKPISWLFMRHYGYPIKKMSHNSTKLTLKKVGPRHSGYYACHGSYFNSLGSEKTRFLNIVELKIQGL